MTPATGTAPEASTGDTTEWSDPFHAVELAPHEFAANFLFVEDGLDPFFAAGRLTEENDGPVETDFRADGERWQVQLYSQESGLVHPGRELPSGTAWELDRMREYRLAVTRHPDEDPEGQQGFDAHMAPRWQGMQGERQDGAVVDIPVPAGINEGINVRVQGANIAFDRYLDLLRRAAAAVGVRRGYFKEPHPYSNVQDAEKYARLDKAASGPVHARDGPIASMAHLLEHDRTGYRKTVQNDRDSHGNDRPGYYHTVTLDSRRVREVFPSHELPVEVKHYYAKEAENLPDQHPLAHPKLGASYQVTRWDGTVGVTEDDLAQLEAELDRIVYSVLAGAGIDLAPGGAFADEADGILEGLNPYVDDAYFDAEVRKQSVKPVALDVERIRTEQESVVVEQVVEGMSPVEREALETLVTDGGKVSPADIASEHGRHVESVRRALRRLKGLVERGYGKVALRSRHVAERIYEIVRGPTEKPTDEEVRRSAFAAWAANHAITVLNRSGEIELDLGRITAENSEDASREIRELLREGHEHWKAAGRDPVDFRSGEWRAVIETELGLKSTSGLTETTTQCGQIWQSLDLS